MQLTLVTYNIHACIGGDGRFDPERIVKVLRELDADVVALQEVEHHDLDGLDALDYLAAETGLTAVAGPTLLRKTRRYGNAVLTNRSIRTVKRTNLSLPGHEPRGALDILLDCNPLQMRVVATHLGLWPTERRRQVRQLISLCEAQPSDICVLMGDLNEWLLWGRILRWLQARFKATPHYPTYPARWPLFALDRIWVDPPERLVTLAVHSSPLARTASDHLPLKGVIESGGIAD